MISFIYFDLGGVVIKDFSASDKWSNLLCDLGIPPEKHYQVDEWWDAVIGPKVCLDLDIDTQLKKFEQVFGIHLPQNYSMLRDFVSRFEPNPSLWPLIDKIQSIVRIGLLTNNYPRMFKAIRSANLLPPVNWQVIIDSSVIKLQKPDPKIFEFAQKQAKTPARQILFIDNTQRHLDAASAFGWQTFWYDSSDYERSTQALKRLFK